MEWHRLHYMLLIHLKEPVHLSLFFFWKGTILFAFDSLKSTDSLESFILELDYTDAVYFFIHLKQLVH